MNGSKLIIVAALVVLIAVPAARESISSIVRNVFISSGAFDASPSDDTKAEPFDFGFKINDLNGNAVDFKTFKGRVIFLNLWATWCGPCRSEMPSIQKLYGEVDQTKVAFVMLSLDDSGFEQKVKKYIQEKQFSFPVYIQSGRLTNQLSVDVIPTTFVIGKDGAIAVKEIGMKNYHTAKFKKFLEKLTE